MISLNSYSGKLKSQAHEGLVSPEQRRSHVSLLLNISWSPNCLRTTFPAATRALLCLPEMKYSSHHWKEGRIKKRNKTCFGTNNRWESRQTWKAKVNMQQFAFSSFFFFNIYKFLEKVVVDHKTMKAKGTNDTLNWWLRKGCQSFEKSKKWIMKKQNRGHLIGFDLNHWITESRSRQVSLSQL